MVSIAEVDALTAAMPERWRIAVELAAWCHLRPGELLGLERRDIDLLHHTDSRRAHGASRRGPARVRSAQDRGRPTCREHPSPRPSGPRATFERLRRARAAVPVPHQRQGRRLRGHALNTAWQAARQQLGRPEIHFHDLRGAGLTWAATQGATTRELMARAGHASPAAALRYQHVAEDPMRRSQRHCQGWRTRPANFPIADPSAGYSRDDGEESPTGSSTTTAVDWTSMKGRRAGDGNRTRVLSLGS